MKQTVYIASPESQQIHVWNLNHEGALTLTQVVDVPGQVQPMVVSPDKRYLYVGVRPEFRVLAYRIAPDDGALTLLQSLRCRGARRIFPPITWGSLSLSVLIMRVT